MFKQKHVFQDKLSAAGGTANTTNTILPAMRPIKTLGYHHLEKVIKAFDNLPQSAKMIISMDEIFMTTIDEARNLLDQ